MKCPKCRYIGFETGDRCRNCGYDFSLLSEPSLSFASPPAAPAPADPDLRLHDLAVEDNRLALDLSLRPPETRPDAAPPAVPALPLFRDDEEAEDEPLVRMAAPRPPIAVRKTPDAQRLRFPRPLPADSRPEDAVLRSSASERPEDAVLRSSASERPEDAVLRSSATKRPEDAVLEFGSEPDLGPEPDRDPVFEIRQAWGLGRPADRGKRVPAPLSDLHDSDASPLGSRLAAALIDFGLLFAIDAVVIHFTLRLTSLTLADWRLIPLAPLLIFLFGLKLAYLSAFTLAGGQTIGKMALGICVIGDDDGGLDLSQAVRRAVVEVASVAAAGVPFLLALADPGRRGLHDRVAHTRVVALS